MRLLFVFITLTMTLMFSCVKQSVSPEKRLKILEKTLKSGKSELSYYVYLPTEFSSSRTWPVLLYLHGNGQGGSFWNVSGGLGRAIKESPERFPFVIVFPICPMYSFWVGETNTNAVEAFDRTVKEFYGDTTRLFVSGVSMGGYGAYICAVKDSLKYAGVVPLSGGVVPPIRFSKKELSRFHPKCKEVLEAEDPYDAFAKAVGKTPFWVFHGSLDKVIPVSESHQTVQAIKKNQGTVDFTEYPDRGHDIENSVFFRDDLISWLLKQKRSDNPQ